MKSLVHILFPHTRRAPGDVLRTGFIWEMIRSLYFEYFGVFHCVRFRGQSNIPTEGPVIFAPNHVSYYDPPIIAGGIPYRMRFLAWDAIFRVPILGPFLLWIGAMPVKLQSADKAAITQTLKVLRNHEVMMIFPEGTRSETGQLGPFENGVARVALQTGARIIPITITGAFEAWPPRNTFPRWGHPITIKYHPAIFPTKPESREDLVKATTALNEAVRRPILRRLKAWESLKRNSAHSRK